MRPSDSLVVRQCCISQPVHSGDQNRDAYVNDVTNDVMMNSIACARCDVIHVLVKLSHDQLHRGSFQSVRVDANNRPSTLFRSVLVK